MRNGNEWIVEDAAGMMSLCKRLLHIEQPREGAEVSYVDGVGIDEWLREKIDAWYARLLESAPIEHLPVEDVKGLLRVSIDSEGVVSAWVPSECVRPVRWKLRGWRRAVNEFVLPDSEEARSQQSEWTRGGKENPVIVDEGDVLRLYGLAAGDVPVVEEALCVVRPLEGEYKFHRSELPGREELLGEKEWIIG